MQNSRFLNNLIHGNHAGGMALYRIDAADGSRNNVVAHNTIVQAADGRWALNIRDGSTGNSVYNNILYNHHPWRGSITISADSLPGFQSDHNVVMERFTLDDGGSVLDLARWSRTTGQDLNSVVATPDLLFVDAEAPDFRLSPPPPRGTGA